MSIHQQIYGSRTHKIDKINGLPIKQYLSGLDATASIVILQYCSLRGVQHVVDENICYQISNMIYTYMYSHVQ